MKNILTSFLLFATFLAQAQWVDNFNDGDFTNAPTWQGQTANFEIDGLNQLHIIAPAVTDTSYLSVASTSMISASWEFYVNLTFGTSGSNMCRVYMSSDNSNLKSALSGYFVLIGNTSDEVSLYRQDGITKTKIIDGTDGLVGGSSVSVRVKVTRDAVGNWEVLADNTGGSTFVSQGTVLDDTYLSSLYAGVHCKYTSTRSTKFYFDDFVVTGTPYVDNTLPSVVSVSQVSNTSIDVLFSENMDQTSVETITNYTLDYGYGNPASAVLDGSNLALVHLTFNTPFVNNTSYFLTTENVDDLAGNTLVNSVDNFFFFISDFANPDDVLITEFMADYSPSIGLPEQEFVEIYNNSNKFFDLAGWTIGDASTSVVLTNYILLPNQYVLITPDGVASQFGIFNTVEVNLPLLNNSGDAIVLKSDLGNLIDSISYDLSWYHDSEKDGGGWSIERKRLSNQCTDETNWSASINSLGGTPGLENSVFTTAADTSPPLLINYTTDGDTILNLEFDELVIPGGDFDIVFTPALSVISVISISETVIQVKTNTMTPGVLYSATVAGISNCWGSAFVSKTFEFGLPLLAEKGDVVINEIMFNPLSGGSDYIELVNVSDKVLSLENWFLANISGGQVANYKTIINNQKLFLPGDYILITEDTTDIKNDFSVYGIGTFIETDIPTYANDSATVILLTEDSLVLDQVHYDENYHFGLLTTEDGKALERISFTGSSNSEDNWHTASELVEWGTPGYKNSQFLNSNAIGEVSIDPAIFSPDNDGYQDVVSINYEFVNQDNVMDVQIFDYQGRLIRELKDNFYAGVSGLITWDGINDEGTKASVGSYVLLITVFDLDGNRKVYKEVVVLATKL